jgi:hypothetical protein
LPKYEKVVVEQYFQGDDLYEWLFSEWLEPKMEL